ncbi:glycosyltransferase [Nocardia blacklockiae]|uniref:glycosyltransferase n=1 Tax=Nocardia blacklockiae TaxID=480036 RepID=UPI0018939B22|nr:glycosyltransferase [Nocardia blacklockiae]MBF6174750.1 glycosyltransferase [Nocardia blacklockiae]
MVLPSVSVVIPTYVTTAQDVNYLDIQLDALAEQDYAGSLEVVVADNGSPVAMREHILGHRLRARLRLRWVDAAQVRGAAHARNAGAEAADGEILLFCDHDDRVTREWASRLVEFLDTGYDLVSSAVEGRSLNPGAARVAAEIPEPDAFQPVNAPVPVVVGCSMACRAAVFRKVGGLDVGYPANEDVEFGFRVHRAGFRVGYLPAALVAYRYRHGFRAGLRQGWARGRGLARLHADFPGNGLPALRLPVILRELSSVALARKVAGEERGLLLGLLAGQLLGGLRRGTLRFR